MNSNAEIKLLNLEEISSGGNGSNDSVTGNNTTPVSVTLGTNDEKNLIRVGDIDCKTRMKRHTEKENEISIEDQVRREMIAPPEGLKNSRQTFSPPGENPDSVEYERKRHLPEKTGNESSRPSGTGGQRPPRQHYKSEENLPQLISNASFDSEGKEKYKFTSPEEAAKELRKQNQHLIEAFLKLQKAHATEKKRFNDTILNIDRALSTLPIRLEKIRVRNQKNLCMINSKFSSGDGKKNLMEVSGCDSPPSEYSITTPSQDSQSFVSSRMKCLLQKMDQLNVLIHKIKEGDSSPIEVLVNSELYAISLLKSEIKTTQMEIDEKTDTETLMSYDGRDNQKEIEDSSSKAKNSFSNELNKASNFKIFENHMMLQEEALHLLTRKIKETEEALLKEVEAKEAFQRENEAMAKEIFRLKSAGEESKGEKLLKTEKLKPEAEATGNRPYRLIKELKTKLEAKEKSLVALKSKCSRSEAAGANKTALLELERKKNSDLENEIKTLKVQVTSMASYLNALQCTNKQLRHQVETQKQDIEELTRRKIEEINAASRSSRTRERVDEVNGILKTHQEKQKKAEKEGENKIQEMKIFYERQLENLEIQVQKRQEKCEEYSKTLMKLLTAIFNFGVGADINKISSPSYNRIREILCISPSDLELLFSVYAKSSAEAEIERLCSEFRAIINKDEEKFSDELSAWFFNVIMEKLLQ